ncbi:MAG: RES family NAD+ phosphorylase [Bacteroidetes bacterium]|nr:RES family NAD+ phosphorylase [Bacteroidota bacterium]
MLCSNCFSNEGLKITAEKIGDKSETACENCGSNDGLELSKEKLVELMQVFFSQGSVLQNIGGYAPVYKISDKKEMESVEFEEPLKSDYELLKQKTDLVVFHYGPPLWRLGLTEQYDALTESNDEEKEKALNDILEASNEIILPIGTKLYRLRINANDLLNNTTFDTPRKDLKTSYSRFDTPDIDIFYSSPDLETCLHETRVTIADEIILATFKTKKELKILNIADSFTEKEGITEFEMISILMYKLCTTNEEEYEKCRFISEFIKKNEFEGFKFLSYYTNVKDEELYNIAIFGFPLKEDKIELQSINRIKLRRVDYTFSFGPAI